MALLKKYDLHGNVVGELDLDDAILKAGAHPQSIKDYIVAIRKNARQWSASTKVRKEVSHTGRKPRPQKGQGRSRQGDFAAPQYKGGGIVFGPKPKFNMHVRINRKERRAAIRTLIAEKVKEGLVEVLEKAELTAPKTKKLAEFFDKTGSSQRRVLVLGENVVDAKNQTAKENLMKSLRNLQKKEYSLVSLINGYELARAQKLVVLDSALDEFLAVLGASV